MNTTLFVKLQKRYFSLLSTRTLNAVYGASAEDNKFFAHIL